MQSIEPKSSDSELGMSLYLTGSCMGTGGRIKVDIDDFVVREIPDLPVEKEAGRFLVCRVTARNWETNRLIRELSRRLAISRKRIGFAGTKDKRGVTTQFMTFEGVERDLVRALNIRDLNIEPMHRAARAITLGNLWGNEFDIVIRECQMSGNELESTARTVLDNITSAGGFPNFFGVQRFGSLRPNTHIVGLRIIKKDFEGAVHAYAGNPGSGEDEEVRRARTLFDSGGPISEVLSILPGVMTFEKTMLQYLQKHPGDFVGSLRQLPPNMLMMFVHAVQAKLFNEIICDRIISGVPLDRPVVGDIVLAARETGVPDRERQIKVDERNLVAVAEQVGRGFGFVSGILFGWQPVFADGIQGIIERKVVERNDLKEQDFIVPEIGECTSSGSRREMLSPLHELRMEVDDNSLKLHFKLIKGSYATSLLREITKN